LLKEVKEYNKDIREIIGTGNVVPIMPEMAILDSDNKFYYMQTGTRINVAEWEKINSLHEFGKIVVITTHSRKYNLKIQLNKKERWPGLSTRDTHSISNY